MPLIAALVNAALFVGLALAIGALSARYLILGRSGLAIAERTPAARHAASGGTWGAVLVLVAAVARMLTQVSDLSEPGDDWFEMLRLVLGSTSTGRTLVLQAIWGAVAMLAFASARRERERGWRAALVAVTVLAFTPGLLGHPAASLRPAISHSTATLHVLAAGTWIGGLFHLWRASRVASEATLLRMLGAFHHVAIGAVTVLAFSGATQSFMTLHAPMDLIATSWGRLLILKLALVAATLALGYRHWRGAESQVRAGGRSALSASLARELVLALLVISVTGLLTVTAPPN